MLNGAARRRARRRKRIKERNVRMEVNRILNRYDLVYTWYCQDKYCEIHTPNDNAYSIAKSYCDRILSLYSDMEKVEFKWKPRWYGVNPIIFRAYQCKPEFAGLELHESIPVAQFEDRPAMLYTDIHVPDWFYNRNGEQGIIDDRARKALTIIVRSNLAMFEQSAESVELTDFIKSHLIVVLQRKPLLLEG